jgi:hypothetical protein
MRSVQVSNANGPLEIVKRDIPEPGLDKFVSRYKHAGYAIVTPLLKKDYFQAFNIQGFLAMRLQGL